MVTNQMLPATEGDDTVKAITSFLFYFIRRSDSQGNCWSIFPSLFQNTWLQVSGEEEGDADTFKRLESAA